jgi:hypothetical protein
MGPSAESRVTGPPLLRFEIEMRCYVPYPQTYEVAMVGSAGITIGLATFTF